MLRAISAPGATCCSIALAEVSVKLRLPERAPRGGPAIHPRRELCLAEAHERSSAAQASSGIAPPTLPPPRTRSRRLSRRNDRIRVPPRERREIAKAREQPYLALLLAKLRSLRAEASSPAFVRSQYFGSGAAVGVIAAHAPS